MEEDNELLDWGNEDDEHQDLHRKGSMDHDSRRGDVDEMEDAVSLGEDEDEQGYYAYQREHEDASGSLCDKDPISRPASAHNLTALSNSSDYQSHHSSQDVTQDSSFSFHRPSSSRDSPQRHQNSRHNHSPQRSHSLAANALRLTHALPPKPVVSNVPYLPPSHPSIVEATSMIPITRTAGRESKKTNGAPASAGNGKVSTSPAVDRDPSLSSEWEVRHPRSGGGVYYYNSETHQSTWTRPSSLRASRGPPASQPDFDLADASKHPPTSNPLSYEDRHYRPAGSEPVPPTESRSNDRSQDPSNAHYHRQEEYAMTPPASPTRYRERERARSLSPILAEPEPSYPRGRDRESRPGRGSQRPGRGRIATNPDSPVQQREREPPPVGPDYPERNWGRPPPMPSTEYTSKHDRSTRRPPRQRQQGDDPSFEHLADDRDRAPLRRSVSNRVSNRDREPETREHLVQNPSIPTSRHRSPPPHMRERDVYDPTREREPKMIEDSQTRPAHPPSSSRRDKQSRFDRPVPATATSSATASVTSDSLPVRHRDYMASEEVEYSHRRGGDRERERGHHRGHSHDELPRHANPQPMIPVDSVPPYSRSRHGRDYDQERMQPPADHERLSLALDQEDQSARPKRVPLPPQEMTFRDTVTARPGPPNHDVDYHNREPPRQSFPPPTHSPTSSRGQLPRPGPPVQNNNGIPPTGPRQQQFYDTSRGGRSFPPGSAGADYHGDRPRPPRQQRDRGPSYGQRTGLPSVDTRIDIDREEPLSSSRYPPSPPMRSAEPPSRGMYADREAANAEAPTGPRAMKHPSTSPTTPYGPLPPVGRSRERSPPPFNIPAGGDSRDGRRDYDPRADGGIAWRAERPGPGQHFPPPGERGYPPRRGDTRGGRPNAFSRGPPPVPVSGTNNIPIGAKRPLDGNGPPREPPPPPPMNRYNQKPGPPPPASLVPNNVGYDPHPRDFPPGKAIYERPPPNVPMVEGFRNRFEETEPIHHPNDSFPPQPYEHRQVPPPPVPVLPSGPPSAPPADESKPRREARKSRFDKPADLPPRTWIPRPREPSPSSDMAIHASNVEKEVRVPTPPPVSREPSATSPTWDLPDRPPTSTRHSADESKADGRSNSSRAEAVVEAETRPKQPELLERFSTPPARTSDVYNGGHPNNGPRQSHALPPNPVTHHREAHTFPQNSVPIQMGRSDSRRGYEEGRPRSRWGEPKRDGQANQQSISEPPASHMAVDDPPVHSRAEEYTETRTSKPIRIRRPPMGSGPDVTAQTRVVSAPPMDNYAPSDAVPVIYERDGYDLAKRLERPPVTRRGGSLLDRLSLDDGTPVIAGGGAPPQPSLRDRVQIVPAKRDRDDMMGDYYETQFDGDEGGMDPLSKRPRQKGMKPRRGRRRGGMP